ncbi:heavy-metal-associated domain-containing protein [Nocardia tengchongensis]|uniref:heavy-metal-associated domain-containing protein n=1 Tax=Nocardia tengchongensis TaxID=2055889 RepID=UPI0034060793
MATHVFRIDGMHCGSCALLVDDTVEELPGVRASRTSVKKARADVDFDPARTSAADIVAAIAALGYTASIAS